MSAEPAHRIDDREDIDISEDMARYEEAKRGGRVSHDAVRAWILSKNTNSPLPRPNAGD